MDSWQNMLAPPSFWQKIKTHHPSDVKSELQYAVQLSLLHTLSADSSSGNNGAVKRFCQAVMHDQTPTLENRACYQEWLQHFQTFQHIQPDTWAFWWQELMAWAQALRFRTNRFMTAFDMLEILHYLQPEDVEHHRLVMRDQAHMRQLFQRQDEQKEMAQVTWPTPEETFGVKAGTEVTCRKCQATDVAIMAVQTRSSDEPTSYFFQCRACDHQWKLR